MSPPIRDGSGNSIGSIRLGDGSEIAEVRTGAGDVLFSGSAIPDSAVHQWKIDEGTGSNAADSIGNNDFSITGATWTDESNAVGGEILDLDGVDDGLEASYDSLLSGPNDFSVAFTLDMSDTNLDPFGSAMIVTNETGSGSGGDGLFISIGNSGSGNMEWSSTDGNFKHNASFDISGLGGLTRFCGTHDASNGWTIYVDSNSQSLGSDNANQDSTNQGLYIGENGAGNKRLQSRVDNPIVYNTVLSSTVVQNDYGAQPFA